MKPKYIYAINIFWVMLVLAVYIGSKVALVKVCGWIWRVLYAIVAFIAAVTIIADDLDKSKTKRRKGGTQ